MRNRTFIKIALLLLAVVLVAVTGIHTDLWAQTAAKANPVPAFGSGILKQGSSGKDVLELQGRLKLLGYYTGPVDGVFGNRTYRAVRLFQYAFGMKIDGIVGPKTKLRLWKATKHWTPEMTKEKPKGPVLKRGARGGGVWELQGRLGFLGFYTGKIDGVYGNRTYHAVRLFQYRFGMKIDGIAGPETMAKLRKATRNYAPKKARKAFTLPKSSHGFSKSDINLLARAVYAEGRGEPYVGQVAIAAVILNRVDSSQFPNTVPGIIYQPLAFESVADGQIWMEPDETARKAVMDAINGWDPSGGALYYFNPARSTSKWIWSRPIIKRIGKHVFCK
ncbi:MULTISPECIES: spore cortex-lytic enzyme [unclassified Thermoactinomyces]|jgi:N-acetylmuramoyl-L-alanine amidase